MPDGGSPNADHPLILLPIRLETRFFGAELWIRIYPDTVHVDTHEPELTRDELRWGRHFHEQLWRAAGDDAQREAAWRQLAERFGAPRAAWVARQLTPLNETDRPRAPLPPVAPLPIAPRFPEAPARPAAQADETWTRAPWSRVLPDRWLASAFGQGQLIASVTGRAIPDPLPVGPDPQLSITESPAAAPLDASVGWMVDFAAAEAVGMALRMPLPALPPGTPRVLDRLVVVGLKSSVDARAGADRLTELLRAHQYTDGLAVLEQGAPTNNSEASPSAFASGDPGHERSAAWFLAGARVERGDGSDGDALSRALGVPIESFTSTTGADRRGQLDARDVNRAVWPATWGYYLEQMMHGVFAEADIDPSLAWARAHFVDHVRAGGPLPALRIGKQPYGLLPVTALVSWAPAAGEHAEPDRDRAAHSFIMWQRRVWLDASELAPRMGRNADPDRDFLDVLLMDAVSSRYVARNVMGEKYAWHLLGFFGMFPLEGRANAPFQRWHNSHVSMARAALGAAGLRLEAMAARLTMALHSEIVAPVESLARMDAAGAAELVASQLDRLITAPSLDAVLRHDSVPTPYSLSYLVLRHALLLEYAGAAARVLGVPPTLRVEDDQIGFTRLGDRVETLLARIRRAGLHAGPAFDNPTDPPLREFRQTLQRLKDLPAEWLDLLVRGALDLSAHRLDAWMTSFATKRLTHMRGARPSGAYVGGYGWVENLRPANPDQPAPAAPDPSTPATTVAGNPGFVHAPSLGQATTVAVLRSGHLSHAGTGKEDVLAVDLRSDRARLARWLLEGVRAGQALGPLLGYRFERGLHENHPDLLLDRFIATLRELTPVTATRVDDSGQPAESVPAKHVVDGLKLLRLWRAQPGFFGTALAVSPPPQPAELAALEVELGTLAATVDAVSDALLAESVHQIVRGNRVRAAATLDAIERGEGPPPELEVLHTPRSGSAFTHRVIVACPGNPATPRWPRAAERPRAAAEPALNAWVGRLLGDPRRVRCRIVRPDTVTGAAAHVAEMRLSELGLAPLDVLYASESSDELRQSELEQHVLYGVRRSTPRLSGEPALQIDPARDHSWPTTDLSWSEFGELLGALRRLVGGARPLQAADLSLAEVDPGEGIDGDDLQRRADGAASRLRQAVTRLHGARTAATAAAASLDALRAAMLALGDFGVVGAVPVSASGHADSDLSALVFQAESLEKEANGRLTRVAERDRALTTAVGVAARADVNLQRLRDVFGDGFMALPAVRAPNGADVGSALAASVSVQDGDPLAVVTFHQRMARIREAVERLDDLLRYSEALGGEDSLTLDVAQLPHQPNDRWVGLPARPDRPLASGKLSVIAHLASPVDFTRPVAGLMIDEWVEVVPSPTETTGVVFQSNQPDSCPPQAILLAVPPDPATADTWTEASLVEIVQETIDLAHIRAVTPDLLGELGQYLPALYFPLNVAGDTISTDFVLPG